MSRISEFMFGMSKPLLASPPFFWPRLPTGLFGNDNALRRQSIDNEKDLKGREWEKLALMR